MNIINWLRYKLWYYELASFIKREHMQYGAEIGVKACRSFVVFLRRNPKLRMVGMDLWEDQPQSPYSRNERNERKSRRRCAPFGHRAQLLKGDAALLAANYPDGVFDFVFYDCYNYRISTPQFHQRLIEPWIPKIKQGGCLVGRDFHEPHVVDALKTIGYTAVQPVTTGGKPSVRLRYVRM